LFLVALLPALLFAWSLLSLLCGIGAAGLFYWSILSIDRELSEHLTLRFFSSARMGTFLFTLGFSLMIVAAYATLIAQIPSEKLIPRFSLNDGMGKVVLHMAGKISPPLAQIENNQLSVDEFLLGLIPPDNREEDRNALISSGLSSENGDSKNIISRDASQLLQGLPGLSGVESGAEIQKKLFLSEGRRRMGDMLGREVYGGERVTDVLSEIINKKMSNTFSVSPVEGESVSVLRAALSILLFLSLLSLGSFLGVIWAGVADFVFWLLRGANILAIRRIPVEAEQVVLVD
jgi:hypothetical protein